MVYYGMNVSDTLTKIYSSVPTGLGVEALSLITRHHRLQGSSGLWDAVHDLVYLLRANGFPARTIRVGEEAGGRFIVTPISWDPLEASLEIKAGDHVIAKYDLINHPTLLSAHSPGGEGCGTIRVCGERSGCSGDVILATGYLYDIYLNNDASLILYFNENRYHDAVPYTGLFLERDDPWKSVVMNIPFSLAARIMSRISSGVEVTACWKARVKRHDMGLPILLSCIGDEPGILFISHICHPKPGAHDNASGSVANLLAEYMIERIGEKISHCHVWVPEYTGTIHLWDKLPWIPRGVINLDMVGSKQWITGSTLTLINPPRMIKWSLTPYLWLSLNIVFGKNKSFPGFSEPSIKWGISPYGIGSDHDVFTVWGIEAPMLNEWPSKYYHTDKDTMDTISDNALRDTAATSSLAAIMYYKYGRREGISKSYESYVKKQYFVEALKNNISPNKISRNLLRKPLVIEAPEKPFLEEPISTRYIYRVLGRRRFMMIRRIKGAIDALSTYLPLAYRLGLKDPLKKFMAERVIKWNRRETNIVMDSWNKLRIGIE
jgi:hypothetical protein